MKAVISESLQQLSVKRKDFINVLNRRANGFHSWVKLLELNFIVRKITFKPSGQNNPHSCSICQVTSP